MSGREQGLRFLLVGAFNTAFGFVVFALLLHFADNQVHYLVVLVVATIIAVLAAFTVYRRFVFRVRGRVLKDLGRFSLVYIAALAVNLVVLPCSWRALAFRSCPRRPSSSSGLSSRASSRTARSRFVDDELS